MSAILKGKGIGVTFGANEVLRGVDVTAAPGAATIIIGPSGSGKSTLLRCLSLLEHPTVGEISIDGAHYRFPSRDPIPPPWPALTVVFQQHFLWPHLTNRQNIILPLKGRKPPAVIAETLRSLIELFDMEDFIKRYPNQSSLGQQQRVALARALALEPRYIFLDEVTSALDVEQIVKLYDYLIALMSRDIGLVLVTHLLSFARALLRASPKSRILFLEDGQVLASGGEEILSNPPHPRVSEFVLKMGIAS